MLPIILFLMIAQMAPQNRVAIIVNSLDIGAWILVVRAYLPIFWQKIRGDRSYADTYFLGAVLLNVTALAMSRVWSLGIILAGKPAWMINHWFQSFCYLLVALSCLYFLKVPGSTTSRRYIGWALGISVVIAGLALWME